MIPAPKHIPYWRDSITCMVHTIWVIRQDFKLLSTLPPAAALKPRKGNSLVLTLAFLNCLHLSDIPHLDEMRWDPR